MKNDYLLVHKSILPSYFEAVIKCRELVEGKNISASEACKICNISRSTYYKYKDYIYEPKQNERVIISLRLSDKQGVLSNVLSELSKNNCNIITINQNTPINNVANTLITIDIKDNIKEIKDIIEDLKKIEGVKVAQLLSID